MMSKKRVQMIAGISFLSILLVLTACKNTEQPETKLQRFVLSGAAEEFMKDTQLINSTVHQSFAFDNVNQHIYFVQIMEYGKQLADEKSPVMYNERASNGDLALTQLDFSGNIIGHMYLKGFGHGVQIGVETIGETAYLWTETDSVGSFGSQLARFKFENGKMLTQDSPELEKHRLIENVEHTTVNIDSVHGLLTMRYSKEDVFYFSVFPLEEVKQKKYNSILEVRQPEMGVFQGFVSYGDYLYLLEGKQYGLSDSPRPTGNTYITSVDLNTGNVMERQLISAATDMDYREPEGMSILIPDVEQPHNAELAFGFVSGRTDARLANIYTLSETHIENKNKR